MDKYDRVLGDVLGLLKESEDVGVVGAAVIDVGEVVFGLAEECDDGVIHAERKALNNFKEEYGEPSDDAVVVTTLSPCKHEDEMRVGESCTDLLLSNGISRVHTGFVDPWQLSVEEYDDLGMDVTVTDDSVLYEACEGLFEFFPRVVEDGEDIDMDGFVENTLSEFEGEVENKNL